MTAGDVQAVREELVRANRRFGLPEDRRVVSGYEAGRDEFWRHRFRVVHSIHNPVVDSASLAVHRRQRRAQIDRLEVHTWRTMRRRDLAGEKQVWRLVRVPSVEAADRRHLQRELVTATRDCTHVTTRIQGLLASDGGRMNWQRDVLAQRRQLQPWDGPPLPPARLEALEAARREWRRTSQEPVVDKVRQLNTRRGIGTNSAWLYVMVCFSW